MLIAFSYIRVISHFVFNSQVQTVNKTCYVEIMVRFHENLHRKVPELWSNVWILLYDDAKTSKAFSVSAFSGPEIYYWNGTLTLFPASVRNDFWLFSIIKSTLKGQMPQDNEHVQKIWRRYLKELHEKNCRSV